MRLFVGIPLAETVVRELASVVERLRSKPAHASDSLRWTEPESWHITLQFLGNASPDQLECLEARLGDVRSETVPVQLGQLGCFERAGVLFADVAVTPELAALQQRVMNATGRCGFAPEERPFHPHITLARLKGQDRGTGPPKLPNAAGTQPPFTRFPAREFVLYESHTDPRGATYEIRQRFPLIYPGC